MCGTPPSCAMPSTTACTSDPYNGEESHRDTETQRTDREKDLIEERREKGEREPPEDRTLTVVHSRSSLTPLLSTLSLAVLCALCVSVANSVWRPGWPARLP